MLAEVGLPVTRLIRMRVGSVRLGKLAPGQWRELTRDEVQALAKVADGPPPRKASRSPSR